MEPRYCPYCGTKLQMLGICPGCQSNLKPRFQPKLARHKLPIILGLLLPAGFLVGMGLSLMIIPRCWLICEQIPQIQFECWIQQLEHTIIIEECTPRHPGIFGLGARPALIRLRINNLDPELQAEFKIQHGFKLGREWVAFSLETIQIQPLSSKLLSYAAHVDMDRCDYQLLEIPTKQVCGNVTRYREQCQLRCEPLF